MRKLFDKDTIATGLILGLGSEIAVAAILWLVLILLGESVNEHIRWFGGSVIPLVLILRYYVKKKTYPVVSKTLMVTLFITFVVLLMVIL